MDLGSRAAALTVLASICPNAISQSLEVNFHDDDGTVTEGASFNVLRTGRLVGTLEIPYGPPTLEFVTAFYSSTGQLLYVETGVDDADRAYFVYPTAAPLVGANGHYPVDMPIGTPGSPQLPVGTFTMRLWAGQPGGMTFEPITGEPIGGQLAVVDTQVTIAGVDFAIYTANPRQLVVGQVARFRVLTADPVTEDTYLTVYGDDALGKLSVTQVMIPTGATCSAEFTLEVEVALVEGQIAVMDEAGGEHRSSVLQTALPNVATNYELAAPPEVPETDTWAWCKFPAKAHAFGDGEEVCGDCAVNPSSAGMCQFPSGVPRFAITAATCGFAFTTDCVFFHQTIQVFAMTGGDTYNKPCGSSTGQVSGGVTVGGTIGKPPAQGSGQVGGNYQSTTESPLHQKCCIVRHAGLGDRTIVQCKTVE